MAEGQLAGGKILECGEHLGKVARLGDEAELVEPSDAAGWEMTVLQLAHSAHAAHLRVHASCTTRRSDSAFAPAFSPPKKQSLGGALSKLVGEATCWQATEKPTRSFCSAKPTKAMRRLCPCDVR